MSGELVDFTPFGYLRNPSHVARSWHDTIGGNLRTAADVVGVEWVYPVGRAPTSSVGLAIEATVDGRPARTRAEFDRLGLTSRHHSCQVMGFDWQTQGVSIEVRYFLVEPDAFCARVLVHNSAHAERLVSLAVVHRAAASETPRAHVLAGDEHLKLKLAPSEARQLVAVLARDAEADAAGQRAEVALGSAESTYQQLLAEDARFEQHTPQLSGDWPAHWREGLHHDFQTTRSLVQPAGGIFKDVWPSWMMAWPRVVLAEGILDMQRLAYVDPLVAQRAVLSLFRDALMANVPCVFRGGEYNMVAADGSRCGTSPAWCLPFLNLEQLYLRNLDRAWLGQLYPYAAAYLKWWLDHRTDDEGWLVYKCTWESGEDGNPRLDPTGSGDADISRRVRPVELQATMAHAAGVMAFFAGELGLAADQWQSIAADYCRRTRRTFDSDQGRYRDWLVAEQRFQEPCPEMPYWGADACRYSAQSLTPLLIGEPLPEQEVWRHAVPPWTLWPSWTISLVESAAAAGLFSGVGGLAWQTIDRVYRVTTRRELQSLARPLPGCAAEFWPTDWSTYSGNDAYGWGATTANLLIRHLVGFKEARETDGWVAELTPALPPDQLGPGRRYGVRRLSYRGLMFDLTYVAQPNDLRVELELSGASRRCVVDQLGQAPQTVYHASVPAARHTFGVNQGGRYRLRLT